jgi:hypothetical protein
MAERTYDRYGINLQRPHLVLLGAGASLAAFPNGEKNELKLPLMNNFVETVDGLSDCFNKYGIAYNGLNFEDIYSSLCKDTKYDEVREEIEELTYDYFDRMELPDEPTLYDHLILSLTGRDVIATFNWDPFLWQAVCRNCNRVGKNNVPHLLFLHGNTAIGFCAKHKPICFSDKRTYCKRCGEKLEKSRLLYPIAQKDYTNDPYIKINWDVVKAKLNSAYMFTIFGYGAPSSDIEAMNLLSKGWGEKYQREMEQIEVIDIVEEDILRSRWDKFIHTHHYGTHNDFYSSMIGQCSRRSADASFGANFDCIAWEEYPIPKEASWEELDKWLKPYIEIENKAKEHI